MGGPFIVQSATFLPNEPVANDDMERLLGQSGDRPSRARRVVLRSNGILTRHYAIDPSTGELSHTNAQLTAAAIRTLMDRAGLSAVPCLSCGTSSPDQLMPNHALMTQGELGLPACEAVATSGICVSGFAALNYAYMAVATGRHELAVATGSELVSPYLLADRFRVPRGEALDRLEQQGEVAFERDFLRWMLSDGAGALLVQSTPRPDGISLRIDWTEILSYAGEMPVCMYAGASRNEDGGLSGWAALTQKQRERDDVMSIKQDVRLLNEHVIDYTVDRPLARIAAKHNLQADGIDFFLPHYSSEYFRDRVHAGLKRIGFDIPQARWFTNLAEKGNTGGASMYIMLDELFQSGHLRPGQRLLCWVPESGRFSSGFVHLTVVG